jgi:hypothetical protein
MFCIGEESVMLCSLISLERSATLSLRVLMIDRSPLGLLCGEFFLEICEIFALKNLENSSLVSM